VARELDQQGVRLFTDGRYREAQQLFERAHARGGPSSELWNIARCQQKLDDTKGAMETLTEYVSKRDIEHGEREEAQRELEVLRRKPVRVVVVTEPPGASVVVGERKMTPMGRTPAAFDLAPGDYAVTLTLAGYSRKVVRFVAESGSPVTIAEELSPK
jgi:sugar/nucleoside kinase (ribokinase family)